MKKFNYPLDPILKQHEWEVDTLKTELMTLNQAVNAKQDKVDKLMSTVRDAQRDVLNICRENAIIDLSRKALIEIYLREQCTQVKVAQEEMEQVKQLADRAFLQLQKKRQSQKGIEKHRDRKKKDFDSVVMRNESLEADELWLAKLSAKR